MPVVTRTNPEDGYAIVDFEVNGVSNVAVEIFRTSATPKLRVMFVGESAIAYIDGSFVEVDVGTNYTQQVVDLSGITGMTVAAHGTFPEMPAKNDFSYRIVEA